MGNADAIIWAQIALAYATRNDRHSGGTIRGTYFLTFYLIKSACFLRKIKSDVEKQFLKVTNHLILWISG